MAPTSPSVPVPVLTADGVVSEATAARVRLRDRLGCGPVRIPAECEGGSCSGPRLSGFSLFGKADAGSCATGSCRAKPQWCTDCAPAVRHPLPPLPSGIITVGHNEVVGGGGAACPDGGCGTRGCGDHSCWDRFKAWLCYRPTPVHLPCTPTPRITPLYTYVPCQDRPGLPGGCATGHCGGGKFGHGHGLGLPARGVNGTCTPCPAAGEQVIPGYRLANPEGPAVAPPAPVVNSAYRTPAQVVPTAYRPTTPAPTAAPTPVVPYKTNWQPAPPK
jgi:hypothetical protein